MNDQHISLPPESVRLILIVAVVIALLGGFDGLITVACIAAVILYLAGWNLERTRIAARSLVRSVIGD